MQSVTIKLIADSDMLNINGFSRQTIAFASDFPENIEDMVSDSGYRIVEK